MRLRLLSQVCVGVFVFGLASGCTSLNTEFAKQDVSTEITYTQPQMRLAETGVSEASAQTADKAFDSYESVNTMIENADMSAFMLSAREAYTKEENTAAWGFAVVDMLLAGQVKEAREIVEAMPDSSGPWAVMSNDYLRPWVLASVDEVGSAVQSFDILKNKMPDHTLRGHKALFFEGLGDYDQALEVYNEGPDVFDRPGEDETPSAETYARFLTYSAERVLALRHADLLTKLDRLEDARAIYAALLEADEEDGYSKARLKEIDEGEVDTKAFLTLENALGMALNDQADLVKEREFLLGIVVAKGAKAPFNHFVSALRQTASLLYPRGAIIRSTEAHNLYSYGFFNAAARFAVAAPARTDEDTAALILRAAESRLEAGETAEMVVLSERALALSDDPFTILNVAEIMVKSNNVERAQALTAQVLEQDDLEDSVRAYAHILTSEALQHQGDKKGAAEAARLAYEVNESDETRGFLASTLSKYGEYREEGLDIYRELFTASPDNPGMMNNFGYALISNPENAKQLDEGYRLLKKANRLTPFEPNLLDSLGWAYYQYGDYDQAQVFIEKAIEFMEPFDHWELHSHLGDVYWRQGREDEARIQWDIALQQYPPKADRDEIKSKLANGLTSAAPEERTPPFVPKEDKKPETRSI